MSRQRVRGVPGVVARSAAGAIAAFLATALVVTYPFGLFLLFFLFPLGMLVLAAMVASLAGCVGGGVGKLTGTASMAGLMGCPPLFFISLSKLSTTDEGVPGLVVAVLLGGALIIAASLVVARCRGNLEAIPAEPRFRWQTEQTGETDQTTPQDAQPQDAPDC